MAKKSKTIKAEETIKIPDPAKVRGKTTIKVEPIQVVDQAKPPRQKVEPIPTVSVEPIREKIRREEWECRKCLYHWYPTKPPSKCPNCGSKKIIIKKIEEQYSQVPKFDVNLFKPIVAFPYSMWAEKTGMPELRLTPPEIDVLAANFAEVCNYYMTDWMRENGVMVSFVMALALVTTPKIYIWKMGRVDEQERSKKIQPEEAQPPKKIEEKVPEPEKKPEPPVEIDPTMIEKRLNKAFGGVP